MNILFPYMARWSSGHASRYYHLLTQVAEQGHTIYVIQPPSRNSGELNDVDVSLPSHSGITVLTIQFNERFWNAKFPSEKLVKKLLFTLKSIPLVKRTMREKNIDLLYIYNLPQAVYLIGRRPRVVFDFPDDLLGMLAAELSIGTHHVLYRIASSCLRWIIRRSDVVICISRSLFDSVDHPRKYLIPNGANLDRVPDSRTSSSVEKSGITVGYVGTFEYTRAISLVIEVAGALPDVSFLLVGSGRDFADIQSAIARRKLTNICLTGVVPHEKAMEYIESMDICLNIFNKIEISHAISPIKLFEYLAHKKPVISTRLEEVERLNEDFLFFADSAEEIVEKIRYICAHDEEAKSKANRGYEVLARKYTWSRLSRDFLEAVKTADSTLA